MVWDSDSSQIVLKTGLGLSQDVLNLDLGLAWEFPNAHVYKFEFKWELLLQRNKTLRTPSALMRLILYFLH